MINRKFKIQSLATGIVFIFFVFTALNVKAQLPNNLKSNTYACSLGGANFIAAYSKMPAVSPSYITSFQFSHQSNGKDYWQKQLNYPDYGIELLFGKLNNACLGNLIAIQPFMRLYLIDKTKDFGISFIGGLGFSYFTNPYHPFDNPSNALIGSHLTNYTRGEILFSYQIKSIEFFLTAGVFHFSNGHVSLPNIGANAFQSKIGILYKTNPKINFLTSENIYPHQWKYEIGFALGFHAYGSTVKPYGAPVYPIYTVKQSMGKNLSQVYRVSLGINASYYRSFYQFLCNELIEIDPWINSLNLTAFFGQELCFNQIALYGEFGIDIFKPFLRKYGDLFQNSSGFSSFAKEFNANRLGLKYYIKSTQLQKSNLSIGLFIKTNFAQADFVECAVNYRL